MKKTFLSLLICIALLFGIKNLGYFFDITEEPSQTDLIVVLGGGSGSSNRVKKAYKLYEQNLSSQAKMILTGEEIFARSERISYLINHGVSKEYIILASHPENTLQEIRYIKHYMLTHDLKRVIIVSDPPHSRRIMFFANTVFDYPASGLTLAVVGSESPCWDAGHYYIDLEAMSFLIKETIKYNYYLFRYYSGSLDEF